MVREFVTRVFSGLNIFSNGVERRSPVNFTRVELSTICHKGPKGNHWQIDFPAFWASNSSGSPLIAEALEANRATLGPLVLKHNSQCTGTLQLMIIAPNFARKIDINPDPAPQ